MTRHRWFMAGCVMFAFFSLAHLLATTLVPPPEPTGEDEKTLQRLQATVQMEYPGAKRTTKQILDGFSIFLDTAPLTIGLAGLAVATVRPRPTAAIKRLTIVYAIGGLAMLVNSFLHWFMIPTPILGLATLFFVLALVLDGNPAPGASGAQA